MAEQPAKVARIQLALCLKEKACPDELHTMHTDAGPFSDALDAATCPKCHGTGKVPLLDPELVREKCDRCFGEGCYPDFFPAPDGKYDPEGTKKIPCESCNHRGWGPTKKLVNYTKAVGDLDWQDREGLFKYENIAYSIFNGELAVLEALAKALGVGQ